MPVPLTGYNLIGRTPSAEDSASRQARHAGAGTPLPVAFHEATANEIDRALELAADAFDAFRECEPEQRAVFLEQIAVEIERLGDGLLERTHAETGLAPARLAAERSRTVNQARLFAAVTREGSWVDARIDRALPERKPAPRPDIRRLLVPIGPIIVFGASNFPLAISVAGCDTLGAFAVGCPVVIKTHPSHPGTAEMVARAVLDAAEKTGMPDGVLSLLHGVSNETGRQIVMHPRARAVAFTGSLQGGRALFDAAAARPDPIPVYAEMGSVNPVFVLPGALARRSAAIAEGFVQSMTLGVGQFCTQPGLVIALGGKDLDGFTQIAGDAASRTLPAVMLNDRICRAFHVGTGRLAALPGVRIAGQVAAAADSDQGGAALFSTDVGTYLNTAALHEELFGPSSIVVSCSDRAEMLRIAEELPGQLTATLHGEPEDLISYRDLLRILERKAGRLVFNGFPTGVEVCAAMHHGGPYPATTHSHFTSIGTAALLRFTRPVCYQDFPDEALPQPLRNRNARGIWRLLDGRLTKEDIA